MFAPAAATMLRRHGVQLAQLAYTLLSALPQMPLLRLSDRSEGAVQQVPTAASVVLSVSSLCSRSLCALGSDNSLYPLCLQVVDQVVAAMASAVAPSLPLEGSYDLWSQKKLLSAWQPLEAPALPRGHSLNLQLSD